jgi:hypothetical protein
MMCDPSPADADDGRDLVLDGAELQLVVPTPSAGMVRLGGDQVSPRDQLVAFDGGVVVDRPPVITEDLSGVVDTNRKTDLPRWHGTSC